jgi:predicted metal-dependent phosphoesterase TrpH
MLNVDLHCHSKMSDGVFTPSELAVRSKEKGVDVWALTDHDELSGIAEARAVASDIGLQFIAGVEISITWAGKTVHIVGLNIDEHSEQLIDGLASVKGGRYGRGKEIAAQLAAVGIAGAFEGALKYAENPESIGRTHFARYIVELGVHANVNEVFRHFLIEGKPGFVPHRWATLAQAVGWIGAAGGRAVIAHPGRYAFDQIAFDAMLDSFQTLGGAGIEVVTGSHTPDQYQQYAKVAKSSGLLASRGSDFHGPAESLFDLGSLPPLPADLTPIWHDWVR